MEKLYTFFFIMLLGNMCQSVAQNTFTSVASGNWNNSATWSPNGVPGSGDVVYIGNHLVKVTSNANCVSITTNSGSGESNLVIDAGVKLTLSGDFTVQPSNANDNNTFLSGGGNLEVSNVIVGFGTMNNSFPTTTRRTTLYVDELAELKINQNIISTTPVNGNPVAFNESRLRHRSGVIDIYGILSIPDVGPGPAALGYRTDNENQGNSTIIFRNVNPGIPTDIQKAPSFTGGTVEFRSTSTSAYTPFPSLSYKNLILNSNRTFTSGSSNTSIVNGGRFELKLGIFSSSAANQIRLNDDVTIIRSGGSIAANNNSRPRLTNVSNKYNVNYEQNGSSITTGRELLVYSPDPTTINPIKSVQINTSNGVSLTNNIQVESLVISKSCSINGLGKMDITDLFDVTNSSIVNVVDNQIKLVSNTNKTARVGTLLDGTVINGNVIVERFLPNNQRSWRLITAPVKGSANNSVWYNWQNNGNYSGTDTGVDIWGPTGSLDVKDDGSTLIVNSYGNGLSLINNSSYNLRKFNNSNGAWLNVSNTLDQSLFTTDINQGFLMFATHPFLGATDLFGVGNSGSSQTTLSAVGQLITGDVTYSDIATNKFYLIGNPYASPINFKSILDESGNEGINKIWIIDPTIGLGSYVTWDAVAGYSNAGTSFSGDEILQSGQAFFVRAAIATSSLTIKESHKSTVVTNATLSRIADTKNSAAAGLFRILLEKEVKGVFINRDGCVAAFYEGGSNSLDVNDGRKLANPSENLSLYNTNFSLSIEHRAPIQDNDFLTVQLSDAVVETNYKLKMYVNNFTYAGNAYLQDLFTGSTTQLPLDGSVFEYIYQVTNDPLSTGNRFKVVFKTDSSLGVPNNVTVTDSSMYPNPAGSQDLITVLFHSGIIASDYSYKIFNVLGSLVYQGQFSTSNAAGFINHNGKLTRGVYFIQLVDNTTNDCFTKKLIIK